MHALKIWCSYLQGKKLFLLTDNTCVKNLFTHPRLNHRKVGWMAFSSKFYFEVKCIKGKENRVVDALRQITHEVYEITMSQLESDLLRRIKTTSIQDIVYISLLNKLQKDEVNLNGTMLRVDQKWLIQLRREHT